MFVIAGLTPDQVRNIKAAIARATTLEEIERLNQMLRTGQIPGDEKALAGTNGKIASGTDFEESMPNTEPFH